MELLIYNELHPKRNAEQFKRVCKMLEDGNFQQAEVKKLSPTPYYRAKLNDSDRLLFSFMEYRGTRFALLLEIIYNHEYEKSRFLNGAVVDENRISVIRKADEVPSGDVRKLTYRNPGRKTFHLLDRPLSFDELQEKLFSAKLPLILVGSAGSGKTVLSLEKVKTLPGDVLYVTRSAYLADNARNLYSANGYDNKDQEVDFLSFDELTRSIRSPEGRQAEFTDFMRWHRDQPRRNEYDAWQLYEEFFGVISGHEVKEAYLKAEEYQGLGIKQSIFPVEKRPAVYQLFQSWLAFMEKNSLYLETIRCFELLRDVKARYDYLVVDEVQDLTNVQLQLALKCLKNPYSFLLCGDSNQIVHPNFFSWSSVKSLFYRDASALQNSEIRILHSNYRNSIAVTETANRILRLKVHRFGSVDRESNFLVDCTSDTSGSVRLVQDGKDIRKDLNDKTAGSVHYAVLVLRESDKTAARQTFKTPLVFSVRESKGLEYRNVIIYNLISANRSSFEVVTEGMNGADLTGELKYSRNRDKSDKSLEIYKFFINSLYVAVTRAVENIIWVESDCSHPMFRLLQLNAAGGKLNISAAASSADEWRREAAKLAAQGKKEQSARILTDVLKLAPVPWEVIDREKFHELVKKALAAEKFNSGAKQKLADYAHTYHLYSFIPRLAYCGCKFAENIDGIKTHYVNTYLVPVNQYNRKNLRKKIDRYGVDFRDEFNRTPLMLAGSVGDHALIGELLDLSADPKLQDNIGFSAFLHVLRYISINGGNKELLPVIEKLAPRSMVVRLNGKEIIIGRNKAENLILQVFYEEVSDRIGFINQKIRALECADLCNMLSHMPNSLVPEYRKARSYCSSILSKNEVNSTNPYGMKLFYRLRNGHYILNPELEFSCEGKWFYWDELVMLRFLTVPLFNLPVTALVLFMQDVRNHLKNASIERSIVLCYTLQTGFSETIPLYRGYPRVSWEELMDYGERIKKLSSELLFPATDEILKQTCNRDSQYQQPFIYPGIATEEIPLRNYLRMHNMNDLTPADFRRMLGKQKKLILGQQSLSVSAECSNDQTGSPRRSEPAKQNDEPCYDAPDSEKLRVEADARKQFEALVRKYEEEQRKEKEEREREEREFRNLREALRKKKEAERQEKLMQKKRMQDMTPDLFDFDSGDDDKND